MASRMEQGSGESAAELRARLKAGDTLDFLVDIGQHDIRARFRKPVGDHIADARRRAGDDGDLALKLSGHGVLLWIRYRFGDRHRCARP